MYMLNRLYILLPLLLLCCGKLYAGPLDDGKAAYEAGDFHLAASHWLPLAEKGDVDAQFNMGLLYRKGQGVQQNDRTALMWFMRAGERGMADAQYNVGVMYMEGRGTAVSRLDAFRWWKLAAEQDHIGALYNLGILYAYGMATAKDVPHAISLWQRAARGGHPDAKDALFKTYSQGLFGQQIDMNEANKWRN